MIKPLLKENIRVRMAPSPTGNLHIGTVRTALFNWLFARHHGGAFILRIEDTDLERSKPEFEENILKGLKWLGLNWDEFYRQSERLAIYEKYLRQLLQEGKAFWCYHSIEELEREKQEQMEKKEAPRHVCADKYRTPEDKPKQIIRLAVDENSTRVIHFNDLVRGHIEFEQRTIGDLSLAKDEQTPLYNFAVVVDDGEMKISHVIRGEDHIANTPKQILIAEALGVSLLEFAHLPLILGSDRSKLSKRHGDTMFDDYIEQGYLPEALINFLALLGWTPNEVARARSVPLLRTGWTPEGGREILSVKEVIDEFDLPKVHKAGAIFDIKKLNWINAQHLKKLTDTELISKLTPFLEKFFGHQDQPLIFKLLPLLKERLEYLEQIGEYHYFFQDPVFEPNLLVWKKSDQQGAKKSLEEVFKILNSRVEWEIFDEQYIRSELDKLAQVKFGGDRGAVYWPLRVALSGEKFSPDPVSIMRLLDRSTVLGRIKKAITGL